MVGDGNDNTTTCGKLSKDNEMGRLSKLAKKHREGEIPAIDWMDRLVFREIELINEQEKKKTKSLYLMIEFPRILIEDVEHTVVYFESGGNEPRFLQTDANIVFIPDPEIDLDNLYEAKHQALTQTRRSATISQLKPDTLSRDRLAQITKAAPNSIMTEEDQDIIWKFRVYLSRDEIK